MKKTINTFGILIFCLVLASLQNCKEATPETPTELLATTETDAPSNDITTPAFKQTEAFKQYWYAGEAELSSYKLEQARYGELREGNAVLVYVTEDFLPDAQVKADNYSKSNRSVLKLNATKNFNTGIYPYSIMQSTFYPVSNNQQAIKVTCSVQEWCGHVYTQLNNRDSFEIKGHSYFASEGDQDFNLEKNVLENELWTQLRIDPQSLPTGELSIIPSMEYIRLKHIPFKAYKAIASFTDGNYTIEYPALGRTLSISFTNEFPFDILGWEETYRDGYGSNAKTLTTKATKLKTIKSPYWSKNSNADEGLRETLQLD